MHFENDGCPKLFEIWYVKSVIVTKFMAPCRQCDRKEFTSEFGTVYPKRKHPDTGSSVQAFVTFLLAGWRNVPQPLYLLHTFH